MGQQDQLGRCIDTADMKTVEIAGQDLIQIDRNGCENEATCYPSDHRMPSPLSDRVAVSGS
jgi:hypothetical protein